MQTNHTPGPWHMGFGNGDGSIFPESGRTRLEAGGTTLYPIAQVNRGWNDEEDAANARLIAAAPDLLAILRHADAWVSQYHGVTGHDAASRLMSSAIRAAIAKATGGAA